MARKAKQATPETSPKPLGLSNDHVLRSALSDLMHERSLPVLRSPMRLRSWLFMVDDADREIEALNIKRFDKKGDALALGRLLVTEGSGGRLWEKHGEFSTYSWFDQVKPDDIANSLGFDHITSHAFDWLKEAPGQVFRSVEISVINHEPTIEALGRHMDLTQAVCVDVFDGAARLWSDFRQHQGQDNFTRAGRILIQNRHMANDELSRLLQSLIEIGHYRKLALLGFPMARELMGWLKSAEAKLNSITHELTENNPDERDILDQLMALSAEVESRVNQVGFRQGATEAYYRLTIDRLMGLREHRVSGFSTMADFIERRLQPAMRTCESASQRLDELSVRIGRVSDLLRARISITLEHQNQALLASMDGRAKVQAKLSELVEGLSVFALTYYIFSIAKYFIEPILGTNSHLSHSLYPFVIIAIMITTWGAIHHMKRRVIKRH